MYVSLHVNSQFLELLEHVFLISGTKYLVEHHYDRASGRYPLLASPRNQLCRTQNRRLHGKILSSSWFLSPWWLSQSSLLAPESLFNIQMCKGTWLVYPGSWATSGTLGSITQKVEETVSPRKVEEPEGRTKTFWIDQSYRRPRQKCFE